MSIKREKSEDKNFNHNLKSVVMLAEKIGFVIMAKILLLVSQEVIVTCNKTSSPTLSCAGDKSPVSCLKVVAKETRYSTYYILYYTVSSSCTAGSTGAAR